MTTADARAIAVNALADRFWDGFLELQPLWATMLGDERCDDRWDDPGPAGRARELRDLARAAGGRRRDRPRPTSDVEERITLDMLRVVAHLRRRAPAHRLWQLDAVDQMAGPQSLPGELARFQRVDYARAPGPADRAAGRLSGATSRPTSTNLREGVAAGRTAARPVVERTHRPGRAAR